MLPPKDLSNKPHVEETIPGITQTRVGVASSFASSSSGPTDTSRIALGALAELASDQARSFSLIRTSLDSSLPLLSEDLPSSSSASCTSSSVSRCMVSESQTAGVECKGSPQLSKFYHDKWFNVKLPESLSRNDLNFCKWKGVLSDGKLYHGSGTFKEPDGFKVKAKYSNGLLHGLVTAWNDEGLRLASEWVDGEQKGSTVVLGNVEKYFMHIFIVHLDGTKWEGIITRLGRDTGPHSPLHRTYLERLRMTYEVDSDTPGVPWEGEGHWRYESGIIVNGKWVNRNLQGKFTISDPYMGIWEGSYPVQTSENEQVVLSRSDGVQATAKCTEGLIEGDCIITNPDGTQWTGSYQSGKVVAGQGTLWHASGIKLKGYWMSEFAGSFTITNPDCSTWEGDCRGGAPWNGQGTWFDSSGRKEEGKWIYGLLSGPCIITNTDGSKWQGEYVNGKLDRGEGVLVRGLKRSEIRGWMGFGMFTKSLVKEEGKWVNGQLNGSCIITNPDGTTWEGEFVNGTSINGHGTRLVRISHHFYYLFKGKLVDDERVGPHTIMFTDGSQYEGDGRSGHGTLWSGRGIKEIGQWVDGKLNGPCVRMNSDPESTTWEGICKDGEPWTGEGVWMDEGGDKKVGRWVEGEYTAFYID